MKRRTRLQSKTPLKSQSELKRTAEMPRGKGFQRKAVTSAGASLVRKVAEKKRYRPKPAASKPVRALLEDRSHGLCEIGLICLGGAAATDTAHRMAKQSGGVGPKNRHANGAANEMRACREDHELIDRRDIPGAERLGLKIRHGVALPSEIPVHLHSHNGWVLLDDEGGVRPAPRAAWDRPDGLLPVVAVQDSDEPWCVAISPEVLRRYGHHNCDGYEWTEDFVVYCVCGPAALFVADVPLLAVHEVIPELAECGVHTVRDVCPDCPACRLCGPCECELIGHWAGEAS